MNAYEKSFALPFDVYQKFVEMQKVEPKIYEYLGDLGFLFDNERKYVKLISGFELLSEEPDRQYWKDEGNNEKLGQCHVVGIDNLCSTFRLLSESVVKDGLILEAGCGEGINAEWLQRNTNAEVKGLDYSPSMLKAYRRFQPTAECIVGDCERMPIKSNSVDQVFLVGLIAVQKDKESMFRIYKEASRVLKPGGDVRVVELCTLIEGILDIEEKPTMNDPTFIKKYMDKHLNEESQRSLFSQVESLDLRDNFVIETMETFMEHSMDVDYKYSRVPTLPRGLEYHHFFRIPYVIIGRKIA